MTTDEATSLLMQYSEWLDVEKINPSEPDPPTHADLVAAFLSQRNAGAWPDVVGPLDEYRGQ